MVVMAVNNRYCSDCLESGEFLPLRLVMMNLDSGLWMCPKDDVRMIHSPVNPGRHSAMPNQLAIFITFESVS